MFLFYTVSEAGGGITTTDGSTHSALSDLLIRKYDTSGNLIFSKYLGGSQVEFFEAIEVVNDVIHVMGYSRSSDYPIVNGIPHSGGRHSR